jgi:hypothetical protein
MVSIFEGILQFAACGGSIFLAVGCLYTLLVVIFSIGRWVYVGQL